MTDEKKDHLVPIHVPFSLIKRCNRIAEQNDTSGHEEFFNALELGLSASEVNG